MEDGKELLDAATRMNRDALTKVFDLHAPALYNYALRLCADAWAADQIVGEVFTTLLEHLSAGNGPATNLRAHLFEIAYHLLIDKTRSFDRTAPTESVRSVDPNGDSASLTVEDRMLFEKLLGAIQNQLTEDQRHVISLRFIEGFSLKETAMITGKNVSNVKVIQNRAMTALRRALE